MGWRIAVKKMKGVRHRNAYRLETEEGVHVGNSIGVYGWGWHLSRREAWDADCPAFSTNIGAAWLVVQELESAFHATLKTPFMKGDMYWAGFTPLGATGWNGRPDFSGKGHTMPLAICHSALLVVRARRRSR